MSQNSFLKKHNLEGTATNKDGEAVYLGQPKTVQPTKYGYRLAWDVAPQETYTHRPLDEIILHAGETLFSVVQIPGIQFDTQKNTALRVFVNKEP